MELSSIKEDNLNLLYWLTSWVVAGGGSDYFDGTA